MPQFSNTLISLSDASASLNTHVITLARLNNPDLPLHVKIYIIYSICKVPFAAEGRIHRNKMKNLGGEQGRRSQKSKSYLT